MSSPADEVLCGSSIELRNFGGWKPGALWKDARFDTTHRDDMDRVGDRGRDEAGGMGTRVPEPFFSAEMRFFPRDEVDETRSWFGAD